MTGARENRLEVAIGRQVHEYRLKLGMTVADLSRQAGPAGMLSKIENGQTFAFARHLQALSGALNVPVTAFFRKFEEKRDATFVKWARLATSGAGTRAGHQYHLLGHSIGKSLVVEPLYGDADRDLDVFPIFRTPARSSSTSSRARSAIATATSFYDMAAGDSLFFDADAPHGPEELRNSRSGLLSVIVYSRNGES